MEPPQGLAALLEESLVVYKGTTDADGNVGGTTLKCSDIGSASAYPDFNGNQIILTSGSYKGQARDINGATNADAAGTITVANAFGGQIVSGTSFTITGIRTVPAEVAALQADVGDASAGTLGSLYAILGNPSHSLAATILDGIDGRTNNSNLNALLGVPDAAGKSVQGNIGDFQAQTNLQTLLAALGIPDVAAKPLYTCLITDRLDNATYGLSALDTDLGTVITDTEKLYDVAFGVSPADGSLASFIATGGTALGTRLPASKSLYDVIALDRLDHATYGLSALNTYIWDKDISAYAGAKAGTYLKTLYDDWLDGGRLDLILDAIAAEVNADALAQGAGSVASNVGVDSLVRAIADIVRAGGTGDLADILAQTEERVAGRTQVLEVSVTSAANYGDVTVATITTQPCVIDSIVIHADAAQTADLTSCGIYGGAGKVITFISATDATQANLNAADKQVSWIGAVRLAAAKTIVMSLVGTGATAVDLTVTITYHAAVNGGYLA